MWKYTGEIFKQGPTKLVKKKKKKKTERERKKKKLFTICSLGLLSTKWVSVWIVSTDQCMWIFCFRLLLNVR